MSLMTQAYLLDKYGPFIDVPALAEVTGLSAGTVRNQISDGTFPVKTSLTGGHRLAHYADVAAYVDSYRADSQA